jgi:hypothetical protein
MRVGSIEEVRILGTYPDTMASLDLRLWLAALDFDIHWQSDSNQVTAQMNRRLPHQSASEEELWCLMEQSVDLCGKNLTHGATWLNQNLPFHAYSFWWSCIHGHTDHPLCETTSSSLS